MCVILAKGATDSVRCGGLERGEGIITDLVPTRISVWILMIPFSWRYVCA